MSLTYGPGARFDGGYSWEVAVELAQSSAQRTELTYAIARFPDGTFRVYKLSAWQAPTGNLLPWSAPPFPPVALVDRDGIVTPVAA